MAWPAVLFGAVLIGQIAVFSADAVKAQSREAAGALRAPAQPFTNPADSERHAAQLLQDARTLLHAGSLAEGRRRLEILVVRFPNTNASAEARTYLGRIYSAEAAAKLRSGVGLIAAGVTSVSTGEAHPAPAVQPVESLARPPASTWVEEPKMVRAIQDDFRSNIGDRIFFSEGSADLGARARTALQAQAQWLKKFPRVTVLVEGHADERGGNDLNMDLARRRAEAVRARLIEEGIDGSRIAVAPRGRLAPVALCTDTDCAAQNRRAVTLLSGSTSMAVLPEQAPISSRPQRDRPGFAPRSN